jgi:hypothetical protein
MRLDLGRCMGVVACQVCQQFDISDLEASHVTAFTPLITKQASRPPPARPPIRPLAPFRARAHAAHLRGASRVDMT